MCVYHLPPYQLKPSASYPKHAACLQLLAVVSLMLTTDPPISWRPMALLDSVPENPLHCVPTHSSGSEIGGNKSP